MDRHCPTLGATIERMKLKHLIEFWRPQEELVASFGGARLVRKLDGRYELRGGTANDRQRAREWISLFLHEACPTVVR